MVSNLLTFGHWKVVFSLFLILNRAFLHFMYFTFYQFRKRQMVADLLEEVQAARGLVVGRDLFPLYAQCALNRSQVT